MNRLNRARLLHTLLVLLSATAACEAPADGDAGAGEIRVRSVSVVLDGNHVGELSEPLTRIRAATAVDDSTVAIIDGMTRRVTVVRTTGRVLSQFGREGEGPGEFRSVSDIGSYDGLLFTFDEALDRVTAFDLNGTVQYSQTFIQPGQLAGRNFRVLDRNRFAVRMISRETSDVGRAVFRLVGGTGATDVTLPVPPGWESLEAFLPFPFETHVVSSIGPNGELFFARTDQYRVLVIRDGETQAIEGERPPIAVLPEERDNYQSWADFIGGGNATRKVPAVKPVIRDLWVAGDGSLVVELYSRGIINPYPPAPSRLGAAAPQLLWTEAQLYDLYGPTGRYVGRLPLPLRSRLLDVRLPSVWVGATDSMGVPRLEHWSLQY